MQYSKYKVSNTAKYSQSVKQVQATVDVQNVPRMHAQRPA